MTKDFTGLVKLAGLWKQEGKDEKVYYSGSLSYSTNILLFPNSFKKEGDKQPDLNLFIARKEKKEDRPKPQDAEDARDSDIPFWWGKCTIT